MTRSSANVNRIDFALLSQPKFGLLRHARQEAFHRGRKIRVMAATPRIATVSNSPNGPQVMTTPRPQAIITCETNSVTSLNSQGPVINV